MNRRASRKSDQRGTRSKRSEASEPRYKNNDGSIGRYFADRGVRETIESIVVAVILALLFRAFEAEAFVIPTGSMAPTLMGRHKDVECDKCGHRYRTGDSEQTELEPGELPKSVVATTCPICRHQMVMHPAENANQASFQGDRILVDKFAYEWDSPDRWDVIVFKYPGNPKQNYIKRLIGLPGETIRVHRGDIYVASAGSNDYRIQSKNHRKLLAMLQLVDDTNFIAPDLKEVGWPSRWDEWDSSPGSTGWEINDSGEHPNFTISTDDEKAKWLRYKHVVPHPLEWDYDILHGELPARVEGFEGELISDYYAYNDGIVNASLRGYQREREDEIEERGEAEHSRNDRQSLMRTWNDQNTQGLRQGIHWVGDIALETNVKVAKRGGTLAFDLVEGGVHFTCSIDISSGEAVLSTSDPKIQFIGNDGSPMNQLKALTKIKGAGSYRVRYANCDNRLYLWVNNQPVQFNGLGDYQRSSNVVPFWSPEDPGDAQPAGIGVANNQVVVERCRILRDVYYTQGNQTGLDYTVAKLKLPNGGELPVRPATVRELLQTPSAWQNTAEPLFASLEEAHREFPLGDDQFLPLGDNSPFSSDARSWGWIDSFIERDALIGKALFVYWPHSWNRPIPYWPNFQRMGFIR